MIDFYFDFISPFAYLGSTQIDAIAAKHGRRVDWRPVLVGITVLKIMGMRPLPDIPLKGPYLRMDALRLARMLNVPFRYHDLPDENPLVAMRAFLWLKRVHPDLAVDFAKRTFSRLWVDGKSISSTLDIAEVAGPLGIDAVELARQVAEPRAKEDLKRAVDEAVFQGVFGVPFFRVDGEPLWGVDRLWMLEHWLAHGSWASPRQEST